MLIIHQLEIGGVWYLTYNRLRIKINNIMGDIYFGIMGEAPQRMSPRGVGVQRLRRNLTVETQHYMVGDKHIAFFTIGDGREHGKVKGVFNLEPGTEDRIKVGKVTYYMGHGIERG